ncbi:MAG TPA: TIGR02452 family protein [Bacilli bacterium]|nr:TIGR02452 family protein [Bacilli bacterium]
MKNLVNVFQDTLENSKNLRDSITSKHTFDERNPPRLTMFKDIVNIINTDSVSAVVEYSKLGKTCVLNMASYKRPGGGVYNGARAQEECLFRCSNLIHVVPNSFYPLEENESLYTKDAIFFKDNNYEYMEPITCDVVTISAINLNENAKYDPVQNIKDYRNVTKNKIRLMVSLAAQNGVKNLILGAWGCGVFKNDPKTMAQYFSEVLIGEGYSVDFDNIVFAIINDHNSVGNNFDIFNKEFNG